MSETEVTQVKSKTINELTRAEKEELKALSKEVFGASSRWVKMIEKGEAELITEETTEYVPNPEDESKEGTTRKVNVPVKRDDGAFQFTTKRHTVDSVKQYMLDRKKKIEEIRAEIKKQQDEARAKREKENQARLIQQESGGSAV